MEWLELYAKINVFGYIIGGIVFFLCLSFVLISLLIQLVRYIRKRVRGVCPDCRGYGKVHVGYKNWWPCYTCNKTGYVKVPWRKDDKNQ